ncbi:MAG: pantoate--beta-alanine ligase [Deltaproteobacteria bacterium]|nr:pantoate--beta-alanine ligase [Deltaproteobacteria bacterium]
MPNHKIAKTISCVRDFQNQNPGKSIGFVPTMGYLHEGHLSLVKRAVKENDLVIVSIFVNPKQFNQGNDFINYPRSVKTDLELLSQYPIDLVFMPENNEIYPTDFSSKVKVDKITDYLEGHFRPGHFEGVTTVLAKLFNIARPHRAYFGQKDAQQLIVIKKMVADLNFDIEIIACPTIREKNGLAMSSRNARLSANERDEAKILFQALMKGKESILKGERNSGKIEALIEKTIQESHSAEIEYVSLNDAVNLAPLTEIQGEILISLAVNFGEVRLIDNILLKT